MSTFLLQPTATVQYGQYVFNTSTQTSMRAKFIYDRAERTVAAVLYTLNVRSIIIPTGTAGTPQGDSTDLDMDTTRQILSTPGLRLQYSNAGFGLFDIDTSGTVKDVAWGPKPIGFNARPIGSNRAWMLEWEVEVTIPECANSAYERQLMEFNYSVDWDIDADGYTTVTYAGYITIPMTRITGSRLLPDNADNYREQIVPPIPIGFQRSQNYKISEDKRKLDFTITDTELPPGGIPVDCTRANGSALIHNAIPISFQQWTVTIAATYNLSRKANPVVAWMAFLNLVRERTNVAAADKSTFMSDLKIREGLYQDSRTHSFEVTIFFCTSLEKILTYSGMFKRISDTDQDKWAQSVTNIVGPRGSAQLVFDSTDAIVDLCVTPSYTPGPLGTDPPTGTGLPEPLVLQSVNPEKSWVKYENVIDVELDNSLVRLKPLSSTSLSTTPPTLEGPYQATLTTGGTGGQDLPENNPYESGTISLSTTPPTGELPDSLQKRTSSTYTVYMRGYGVRAGYRVPIPKLQTINGVTVYPDKQAVRQKVLATYNGVVLFHSEWILKYMLPDPPGQGEIGVPPNPALD